MRRYSSDTFSKMESSVLKDSMIILRKELRRIFTDRRLLFFLVVLPLVMMPLMYSFMGRANRSRRDRIEDYVSRIAVLAPENPAVESEAILRAMESLNAGLVFIGPDEVDSCSAMVTDRDLELLVILDPAPGFTELSVYYNSTAEYSESAYESMAVLISAVNDSLVRSRIADLGLEGSLLTALTLNLSRSPESYDLAEEGGLMGKIIGMMVPFFIIIYLFANAMKVGLDTVAGEKERGTLAVLLVNQVGRLSIVMGKMLSVMIAAVVGALSSAVGLKIASRQLLGMYSGPGEIPAEFAITTMDLLQFAVIVIPLALLTASIIMLVSTFARNVKEGQGMVMPVYIAVMVMGITTMQTGDIPPAWMRIAPVFNSLTVLKDTFMRSATWSSVFLSALSSLLLASLLVFATLRMFNDERILFRV